jgi:two-component system response regulator MprA
MRILLAEDEPRMAALLRQGLGEDGHAITATRNGREAVAAAGAAEFDVIVLDVMLPGCDGFEVLRRLRAGKNRTPVLILTARDADADVVRGLNQGADDYMTKPFAFDVLLARLHALARRGPAPLPTRLQLADLTLEPAAHRAARAGVTLALTRTEFALLECLLRRAGRVVSRRALIDCIWGPEREVEDNTLEAFISQLRHKVDAGRRPRLIQTVRGIGYAAREEDA